MSAVTAAQALRTGKPCAILLPTDLIHEIYLHEEKIDHKLKQRVELAAKFVHTFIGLTWLVANMAADATPQHHVLAITRSRSRAGATQSASSTTEVGGGVPTLIRTDSEEKTERAVETDSTTTASTTTSSSSVSNKTTSILDFNSQEIGEIKDWVNEQADVAKDYAAEKIVTRGDGLKMLIADKGPPRILVPLIRRKALIVKTHEHLSHLGFAKTAAALKKKFAWKGLDADVNTVIEDYAVCELATRDILTDTIR